MVNYEKTFYNINSAYITPETSIASWPTETVANTKLYYNNNQSPASNVAPIAPPNLSYPTSCTPIQTDGSAKLYKLNATTNRTGLEFMIKVMAGDKIDIFGKSYFLNTATVNNTNSTVLDLATLMANMLLSPANAAASKGITSTQLTTINTGQVPSSFFRGANGETTTIPKAYINYIFFDEQFKYAGGGASRVGSTGVVKDHWYVDGAQLSNISAPRNGYIFVYVSNESNLDVFFDNLQVIHKPGPILEETHYYPFGLTMSGISSKAAGKMQNKEKTFQGQRFDDDLGLNWVQFKWRNHDPQIGRFIEIDPLSNKYVYNSTYAFSENKVTGHVELEGLEAVVTPDKRPYPERIPEKIKPVSPFPATTQPPSNSESTPKDKDVTEKKSTSVKAPLGEEPLFGKTATNKVTKETDIINTGALGDKITVSSFEGKVTGKEGIVATADGSTNNTGLDGGSVTVGPVILGVNSDFSITVGAGVFGYESHVSAGFGVGLGQASAGFSYTGSDKVIKGADLMVRPGLGSLAVAAVSVVAALLSPVGL
jgi:RHS repeat-associated protein